MFKCYWSSFFLLLGLLGLWWILFDVQTSTWNQRLPPSWWLSSHSAAAPITQPVLIFLRVPKTGSEMLALLLQWLQGVNQFRHVRLTNSVERRMDAKQQNSLMDEMEKIIESSEGLPVSFDRHMYFTDFGSLIGHQGRSFIYFSSIRDPVDRIASQFYYSRATPRPGLKIPANLTRPANKSKYSTLEECFRARDDECQYLSGHHYELSIAYFCGNEPYCTQLNSEKALRQAQHNVESHFPVVGVLEDLNCTLQALETHQLIQPFFANIQQLYFHELSEPKKNKNLQRPVDIPSPLRQTLVNNLTAEYIFYNFIRQRLRRQCVLQ